MKQQNASFIKTVVKLEDIPFLQDRPEIAVVGRSNVGKSTLLNHFLGVKNLAKTSSTPGKTRALNFFKVDEKIIFVDMPGYGYAAVSKQEAQQWSRLVEGYLKQRESLKLLLFLVDIRRIPGDEDLKMLEWIQFHKVPALLVLTKVDKVSQSERSLQTERITDRIKGLPYVHYSATKNQGRKELSALIKNYLKGNSAP
jgi:GTP-binding protein